MSKNKDQKHSEYGHFSRNEEFSNTKVTSLPHFGQNYIFLSCCEADF